MKKVKTKETKKIALLEVHSFLDRADESTAIVGITADGEAIITGNDRKRIKYLEKKYLANVVFRSVPKDGWLFVIGPQRKAKK